VNSLQKIIRALYAVFPHAVVPRLSRSSRKPLIGLAVSDAWPDRLQLRRIPYDIALGRAGARVRTLIPKHCLSMETALEGVGGIVLAGGEDVHPKHYEGTESLSRNTNLYRDEFEFKLLDLTEKRKLPVLAVCRGAQLLAVWAGGRLKALDSDKNLMNMHLSSMYRRVHHNVKFEENSRLANIYGTLHLHTNSFHHQMIEDPGSLHVIARTETGEIEAVELPGDRFVLGVQWHPEISALYNPHRQSLFNAFVASMQTHES